MKKQLSQVKEFHHTYHSTWNEAPTLVSAEIREKRITIMQSEFDELVEAMRGRDMALIAKELGDVLYVVFGTIGTLGFANKMTTLFDEVHMSNMSKEYSGIPDSKAVKGPNYRPANVQSVLDK